MITQRQSAHCPTGRARAGRGAIRTRVGEAPEGLPAPREDPPSGGVCAGPHKAQLSIVKALDRPDVNAKVLVLDDDDDLAEALVDALLLRGFDATAAHAIHLALRTAALRPPDAWIVDYGLPGVNGAELVRWLRASAGRALRDAIFIGFSADPDAPFAFAEAGADGFVRKPASCDEIEAALRTALSRRSEAAAVR